MREAARHASCLCPWVLLLSSKLGLLLALWVHARLCSVLLLSWKVLGPIGGLLLRGILGVALGRLLLLGIRCALRREALAATGVGVACVVALLMYLRVPAHDGKAVRRQAAMLAQTAKASHSAGCRVGAELTTAWCPLGRKDNGLFEAFWSSVMA